MKRKKKIETSLIILTRNEISGVIAMLGKIPFQAVDEYFAVDYRSTDGTVEYFTEHHIPIIRQKNPGRSEAFMIGARAAKGNILIFFSPDGNEDPRDIPKLITAIRKGADLAIASRFMKGSRNEEDGKTFKWRKWANQGFTAVVNFMWGGRITDSINGYRAIRRDSFTRLHIDAKGFAVEFQMSIRALKLGMRIAEFPTHEGERIWGKSTSYAIPTGLQFIRYLMREIFIGKSF